MLQPVRRNPPLTPGVARIGAPIAALDLRSGTIESPSWDMRARASARFQPVTFGSKYEVSRANSFEVARGL